MTLTSAKSTRRLGRLAPLLLTANVGPAMTSAAAGTLLPALLAAQDGAHKTGAYAVMSTVGAIVAVVSTVVAGALSDRTRSRFGRRAPWILGGAVISAAGLIGVGLTVSLPLQVAAFAVAQAGLNCLAPALAAVIPDRVPPRSLGRASAAAGAGYLIGTTLGSGISAATIGVPRFGLCLVPLAVVVASAMFVSFDTDRSTADGPTSADTSIGALLPARDRDLMLAFAMRFSVILALSLLVVYQLFLFTDYLNVPTARAGSLIAVGTALLGCTALLGTVVGGLTSDRLGRRKPLVIIAAILVGVGAIPELVAPGLSGVFVFYSVAGLGYGIYLAVDQALMVEVLPDPASAARDLGALSVANTAPGAVAPVLAAALVGTVGYRGLFGAVVALAAMGAVLVTGIRRAH